MFKCYIYIYNIMKDLVRFRNRMLCFAPKNNWRNCVLSEKSLPQQTKYATFVRFLWLRQ